MDVSMPPMDAQKSPLFLHWTTSEPPSLLELLLVRARPFREAALLPAAHTTHTRARSGGRYKTFYSSPSLFLDLHTHAHRC